MLLTTENNVIRVLAARRYASARALAMALCLSVTSDVGTMGTEGVHCTPQVQDLYPLHPPSQRCGLCQNFKRTTLTTRLYKVRTNLYSPHLRKRSDAPACYKSVFYQNGWTNRAGFGMGAFFQPVLHCVERKSGHLQKWGYFPPELYPKLRT